MKTFSGSFGINKPYDSQPEIGEPTVFKLMGKPKSAKVEIAGNFPEGYPSPYPMKKLKDRWECTLELEAGKYYYYFLVDGKRVNDPLNDLLEPDEKGLRRNVFFVPNYLFELDDYSHAQSVCVAGSFNNWDSKSLEMIDLAFHRDEKDFKNNLLLEQDNENFAQTIVRQYLFDVFQFHFLQALTKSENEFLQAFAAKSIKEVRYHRSLSKDWMLRLGDGTEMSHNKMQEALNNLWPFTAELFEMSEADELLIAEGIAPDLAEIKTLWEEEVTQVIKEATLTIPDTMGYMATGGRKGHHTEYLGYILAEMQYLPRSIDAGS